MREFYLLRSEDVSGVSGVGSVAEGVEFPDGTVVLWWFNSGSMGIYRDIERMIKVHGHEGRTTVHWVSKRPDSSADMRDVAKRLAAAAWTNRLRRATPPKAT